MKKWLLFFALTLALTSAACEKKEKTVFEDAGKKVDQGLKKSDDKIDSGMNKVDEKMNKAGEAVEKGFNKAGEKIKETTE